MGGHDSVHCSDELPADEDHRNRRGTTQKPRQGLLHLLPSGVLVELVDRGVHAHPAEEPLNGVAHTARTDAEYHHRIL